MMGNEIMLEQAGLQPGEIFTDSIRQLSLIHISEPTRPY